MVSILKVPLSACYAIGLNVPSYTLTFFLDNRGRTGHNLDFSNDEEMPSHLSKEKKCEITKGLKYIFSNSIQANFV